MPASGKDLEDSIRLSKIRRIKIGLYVVQIGVLLGFTSFVVFVLGGARITPTLFLPIPSLVAVVLLLFLITCVESFFFRILEIRFARSSSARHLMAKNSMRRSILIALAAGIAAVILAVPSILGAIESASEEEIITNAVVDAPGFFSSDALGLMSVSSLKVSAPAEIEVYIVNEDALAAARGDISQLFSLRLNRIPSEYIVDGEIDINVPKSDHVYYYLVVNDMENPDTYATVKFVKTVSGIFTGLILMVMIALIVVNMAWFAYLIPIERKYSVGSIYK